MTVKFVAFRTQLEQELGDTGTRMRALLLQWTNNVYQHITRAWPWSWLDGTVTGYSHAAAAASFDLVKTGSPSWSAKRILDLVDETDTPEQPLHFVGEMQFWDRRYDATLTGNPLRFRVWGGSVYLHPIPDSIRTLRFRYRKLVTALNTTDNGGLGSDILLPEEDIGILYQGVLAQAMRFLRDQQAADTHQADFLRLLRDAQGNDDQGPGQYVPAASRAAGGDDDWPDLTSARIVIEP